MALKKTEQKESLAQLLNRLIAEKDRITPEQVTVAYIRHQREKLFYGSSRYNISSSYGGHSLIGLTSLTRNESDRITKIIDEIIQEQ